MCKKFLSLFLAFALLIWQTPAVFAAENEVLEEPTVIEQVISEEPTVNEQEDSQEPAVDTQEGLEDSSNVINKEAEASDEGTGASGFTTVSGTVSPDPGLPGNDELFAAYAEQVLYGTGAAAFGMAAGERLSGDEKLLYDALVPYIRQIAAGERASATITVGRSDYGAVDTEVAFEVPTFSGEALGNVLNALMSDYPYEMYWYDKVSGCGFVMPAYQVTFSFTVAQSYRGADAYTADTVKTGLASEVAANAQAIVNKYANSADLDKLYCYKQEICTLVSYDDDAAASGNFSANSDSWQLINVFDNDYSTNVVCEGYSKAFMYLCDLSDFKGDVACYTVSGYMDGGAHMWNIVTMDGCNYLADVTNSDSGSIGADGSLFLVEGTGSVAEGYVINGTSFEYDAETISMWGTDADSILTLGVNDGSGDAGDSDKEETPHLFAAWPNGEETFTEHQLSRDGTATLEFWFGTSEDAVKVAYEDLSVRGIVTIRETEVQVNDVMYLCVDVGATGFGEGAVIYTDAEGNTYEFLVTCDLPWHGFYSSAVQSEETYLDKLRGNAGEKLEFYFLSAEGASAISGVTVTDDYGNHVPVEFSEETGLVQMTAPKQSGGLYFDVASNGIRCSIEYVNTASQLFATWSGDSYQNGFQSYEMRDSGNYSFDFWFGNADSAERVAYEELTVTGVASISEGGEYEENGEVMIHVNVSTTDFGTGAVLYKVGEDTYEFPVTRVLPAYGVYSSETRSEETYLDVLTGNAGETLKFYVHSAENMSAVTGLTVTDENGNEIPVEYDPDTGLVQMTAPERGGILKLFIETVEHPAVCWLDYINTTRHLFAQRAGDEYSDNLEEYSLAPSEYSGNIFDFYFGYPGNAVKVDVSDLKAEGVAAIEEATFMDYNGQEITACFVRTTDFGEGAVVYTVDGVAYKFPIYGELPDLGLYKTNTLSEEAYVDTYDTSVGETVTVYLLGSKAFREIYTITGVGGEYYDGNAWIELDVTATPTEQGYEVTFVSPGYNVDLFAQMGDGGEYVSLFYTGETEEEVPDEITDTCGDNLTWTFVVDTGTLTISGTGPMYDYAPLGENSEEESPFSGVDEIKSVIVEEGVTYIGSNAFEGCNMTLVQLPTTLEAVGENAFKDWNGEFLCVMYPEGSVVDWLNVNLSSGNHVLFTAEMMLKDGGKIGEELYWQIIDGALTFLARGNGSGMYESEDGESYEMPWAGYADEITKIDMQKGITINDGAFAGLINVTELTLPASLLYFQDAIGDLTALEKIEIPAENDGGFEVTADGKAILRSNTEAEGTYTLYAVAPTVGEEFTIPMGVTAVHFNAFKNCADLETLNIPASTTLILPNAFSGCSSLTTVNYDGSAEDWANVDVQIGNDFLMAANIVFAEEEATEDYLAYSYVNYDDELGGYVADSELYTTYNFDYPHYTAVQFFQVSSDGTKTPVRWESLVSGNTDIFTIEGMSNPEDPYVCYIVSTGVGSTTISCGDYSMEASILMPCVAYYTQPVADPAYFIDMDSSSFDVTKSNRTVYLVLSGQRTFTNVELQGDLANYASVEILSAGNAAAITFNDNLPVTDQWGTRYNVYMQYDSTEPDESGGGGYRQLRVINNSVSRLYLNWAQWRDGQYVDEGVGGESELSITPGNVWELYIHFTDGETDLTVPASQLIVGDESVVSITYSETFPDVAVVEAHNIGETYIAYSSDGTEYRIPVVCELPTYGFYSQPEATEANYLQEFVLSESFNTLYYIARDGWTMKDVVLENGGAESSVTVSDDGTIATITLGSEFYETYYVKVTYTEVSPDGYEVTNASDYAYFDVDDSGDIEEEVLYGTCGENVTWELNAAGVLTISGTGEMYNYVSATDGGDNVSPFANSTEIKSVIVEEGVTYIGSNAFEGCNMTLVQLPTTLEAVGENAFKDWNGEFLCVMYPEGSVVDWLNVNLSSGNHVLFTAEMMLKDGGKIGEELYWQIIDGALTFLARGNGSGMYESEDGESYEMPWAGYADEITKIDMQKGITINDGAFAGLINVTELTLPASLLYFQDAIGDLTALEKIEIPAENDGGFEVTADGKAILRSNTEAEGTYTLYAVAPTVGEEFTVPEGVTCIHFNAFKNCANIETLSIPASTALVLPNAFSGCSSLTTVNYDGTETEWAEVVIQDGNEALSKANIICKCAHVIVTDEAVAVTCTTAGLTEGSHCSVCGEVIVAQKPIPATGHYYDAGTVIAEPTCTADGKAVSKCTVCGDTINVRNLDELLVRRLTDTAYMIAGAPFYDYGPEYIINEIVWNYFVNYDQTWEFVVPAAEFEAEVGKYFKTDTMMIQMLREYAASLNPEYASVYYDAESNTYTVRPGGGMGGWEDARVYRGYVKNGNEYTVYYTDVNYIYLTEVLPDDVDVWDYAESLGYPETIEYDGYVFSNPAAGYVAITSREDSGRAVVMEPNENVMRIVTVYDFTAAELPAEFDDVDGGMTGHKDDNGDYHCDVCGENVCASHVLTAIPAVPATCTATGLTEGTKCSACGEIVKAQEVVPMIDHNVSYVEVKEPTFTAAGCNEHYKCNDCGALFLNALDAADNKPCTKEDVIIPQLVDVTDGKAEVKEEVIDEAISNATETTVTLPLTEAAEGTVAAQLPVASLNKIKEADKELTVETNFAVVTMDTKALETIVTEAGDTDSIELVVEEIATEELNSKQQTAISEKKVAAVISAEILVNGDNVHDFDGGVVTVMIPFEIPENSSPDHYYLVYVDDMGNIEEIDTKYENGYLVAELQHFSEYVIMDNHECSDETGDGKCDVCGESVGLWGDADGNGRVNLRDAMLVLAVANKHEDVAINRRLCDVTGEGTINLLDAMWVLKRANQHPDLFPVEK